MAKEVTITTRMTDAGRKDMEDQIKTYLQTSTTQNKFYDKKQNIPYNQQHNWVATCFMCGKRGHKSNYCPGKKNGEGQPQVSRVITPCPIGPKYIEYRIGKNACKMLLDSGAGWSVVHPSVVKPQEWLEQHITVRGVDGTPIMSPLATVWVNTGEYSIHLVVATLETMQDNVLIGRNIGTVFNELFMRELTESESDREITEVKGNERRMENEQKQKDVVESVES